MKDEDIEILDLDDNIDKEAKSEKKAGKKGKKTGKKRRLKKGIIQTVFCLTSIIFIIGCCIFYGSRLIKYYKIYNPKIEGGQTAELISNVLTHNTSIASSGDGLYRENGVYVFKGATSNNYIKYSNMLWRIVRTNVDGSIEIILNDLKLLQEKNTDKETEKVIKDIYKKINCLV